ncbi:PAS domain-containing protein [Alteriqipengyuania flavescens]|uniref:PAS domain-containing protein n=1 Tax=Alteriqipengyuania flavescens TaxID=3053610 RepID=UPI0025B5AE2C|nr:PAS domain-containing protein [Alteriqipengyuania flavescens]WJY19205.1 PAS domain-containing protein [Alteriqipengyuania flavescens]WJY25145.1 PAS domain-containing protein [Alteriqipengyuania flavescens]
MVHFLPDVDLPEGIRSLFEKSRASLTIADLDREDAPLIGLNQAFFDICGYSAEESLGKNCRFLQPETGGGPVCARIREFLYESDEPEERFAIPCVTGQEPARTDPRLRPEPRPERTAQRYDLGSAT